MRVELEEILEIPKLALQLSGKVWGASIFFLEFKENVCRLIQMFLNAFLKDFTLKIVYIYIYSEPKWPLFWGVDLQN